jgi:hypothetical protein
MGSALGGVLAQPADKYPALDTAFFRSYPYLLPTLTSTFFCIMGLVPAYFFLPETLPGEVDAVLPAGSPDPASGPTEEREKLLEAAPSRSMKKLSAWELVSIRDVRLLVLFYGIFSFAAIAMDEIHSVFCSTPVALGGLGWDTTTIGTNLGLVGLFLTLGQTLVFPFVEKQLKLVGTCVVGPVVCIVSVLGYPVLNAIARQHVASQPHVLGKEAVQTDDSTSVWLLTSIVAGSYKILSSCVFCALTLLFNNSVHAENRCAQGPAQGALARSVGGPALG